MKDYEKKKKNGHKCYSLKIGNMVLRRNLRKIERKGGNWDDYWFQPYEITSVKERRVYLRSQAGINLRRSIANIHIKPYKTENVNMDKTDFRNEENVCPYTNTTQTKMSKVKEDDYVKTKIKINSSSNIQNEIIDENKKYKRENIDGKRKLINDNLLKLAEKHEVKRKLAHKTEKKKVKTTIEINDEVQIIGNDTKKK